MHWVAPSVKDTASATLEKRLWAAADQFRANSGLKSQEYSAVHPMINLKQRRKVRRGKPNQTTLPIP